jgi:hypothetical protein
VLEGIAFDLEPEKPVPELEETAQDIAAFFNDDTLKVQEIIDDCVREGLLQVNPETKRILCLKLLAYLDNTLSQNPQVKAILSNFKSLEAESLKQIRLDEIRVDNNIYYQGKYFTVTKEKHDEYTKLYTLINIDYEYGKMTAWLDANEKKRKTPTGYPRFVNSWLGRSNDRAMNEKSDNPPEAPRREVGSAPI